MAYLPPNAMPVPFAYPVLSPVGLPVVTAGPTGPNAGGGYALPPLPTPAQLLSVPVSAPVSAPAVMGRQLNVVSGPTLPGQPAQYGQYGQYGAVVPATTINSTAVYTAPVIQNPVYAAPVYASPLYPTTVPNGAVPTLVPQATATGGTASANTTINLPPNVATSPAAVPAAGSPSITQNPAITVAPPPATPSAPNAITPNVPTQNGPNAPVNAPVNSPPPAALPNGVKETPPPNLGLPQDTFPLTREMVDRWSRVLDGPPSSPERSAVAREVADFLLAHPEVTLEGKPRAIMERLVTNLLSTGRTGTDSGMTNSVERDMILLALSNGGFYNLPDSIVAILQQLAANGTGLHGMEQNLAQGILNQHQRGKDRPAAALLQAYEQRWPAWNTNQPVPTREAPELALQNQAYQGIQQGMQSQAPEANTTAAATGAKPAGWLGHLLGKKNSTPLPSGTQPLSLRQPGQPPSAPVSGPGIPANPFAAKGWPDAGGPLSSSWNSLAEGLPAGGGLPPLNNSPLGSSPLGSSPLGPSPMDAGLTGGADPSLMNASLLGGAPSSDGAEAMNPAAMLSSSAPQPMPGNYDQWLSDWMASQGDGQVDNPFTQPLPEIPGMTQ